MLQKVFAEVFEEICLQVVKLLGKALPANKSLQIFQFPTLGNIKASCKIAMPCVYRCIKVQMLKTYIVNEL